LKPGNGSSPLAPLAMSHPPHPLRLLPNSRLTTGNLVGSIAGARIVTGRPGPLTGTLAVDDLPA
jgi:hypothetical protein